MTMDATDVNMKCRWRIIFPTGPKNTQFTYWVCIWGQALRGHPGYTRMAGFLLQGGLSVEGHQNWRAVRGVWGCWRRKGLLLRKARGVPGEGWDLVWPSSVQGISLWGRGRGATQQRADAKATEHELQGGLGPRVHVNPNRRQKLLLLCKQQDGFEPSAQPPHPPAGNMVLLLGKESPLCSPSHS